MEMKENFKINGAMNQSNESLNEARLMSLETVVHVNKMLV